MRISHQPRDKEVRAMIRLPIRVKLFVGLALVIGMMLSLLGGSIFGLHAFHDSNLTLRDSLRELGASKDLLQAVVRLDGLDNDLTWQHLPVRDGREDRVAAARQALARYYEELEKNSTRGNRADDGRDEFELAFLIDDDLTAILRQIHPRSDVDRLFERTKVYLDRHPQANIAAVGPLDGQFLLRARLDRLNDSAAKLPDKLHRDFLQVLERSNHQYQSSRVIVWTASLTVVGLLLALALLFHRWVLHPVRLLQRGVRRVARGRFDYQIDLKTGDEMQALAEAFNDMTTRLSATYADLEQQVLERSKQLVRSERLAGVGFLAAGVAHEINNPLASIAFCSEALETRLTSLLEKSESGDAPVVRNYLRMIQDEAFRCKRITEKLLDFSRCNDIQRQRTDLASLVREVVEMIEHMGKYRSKTIAFNPRDAVMAHIDGQEIKQVVLNLVVNALDCMESGGTLRIDLRTREEMAELAFVDDGCGMSADVLENIFEPFFTRRKVGKGTGLGLSITHRIVSQHHGEISATSEGEGLGATFIVRLPMTAPRQPDPDAPAQDDSRSWAA
jgi:signal transduction histidine kinase